jgi:5-methylcytosine-specific restriction protein A
MASPAWTRDELILALDLYFREPSARGSKTHPAVIELSDLLNKLPLRVGDPHDRKYRNANGVGMKLSNYLRLDPDYPGAGLERGGHLEELVWNEFSHELPRLHQIAAAIRSNSLKAPAPEADLPGVDEDEEAQEGEVLVRIHKYRERQPKLARKKKAKVLQETGKLECEVCGFDSQAVYGDLGHGFAECHHIKPLAELEPGQRTRLADLAIVCANCHRMLHRGKRWVSIEALRTLLYHVRKFPGTDLNEP